MSFLDGTKDLLSKPNRKYVLYAFPRRTKRCFFIIELFRVLIRTDMLMQIAKRILHKVWKKAKGFRVSCTCL